MTRARDELILFANDGFYAAFAGADADAMDRLWAARVPLICVHPGGPPLFDRNEIMQSWRQILSDPGVAEMRATAPRLVDQGDVALVVCFETLSGGALVATNGFVREDGAWKMVLHQAGPCPGQAVPATDGEGGGPFH